MEKKISSSAIALLFAALISPVASSQAALISIDNLTVSWLSPDPASVSIRGNGTGYASLDWGFPAPFGRPSGYSFTTVSTPILHDVPPSTSEFLLGSWTHNNFPIRPPLLESVSLMLSAEISVDSISQGVKNFYFDFSHNETYNQARYRCANGERNGTGVNRNGCADIVDVNYNDLSDSFMVDGALFTLNLAGGSTHFETVEHWINSFNVYGQIVASDATVPEPTALALFSGGLAFFGFARRRKNKPASLS
jgi:hypothetical protein